MLGAKSFDMCNKTDKYEAMFMTERVQGVIEAQSTLHVPLDVTAQQLEEQETTAHFMIVGSLGFSLVSSFLVDNET